MTCDAKASDDALVARLNEFCKGPLSAPRPLMFEAADRIATLTAERERIIASEMRMAKMQSDTYARAERAEATAAAYKVDAERWIRLCELWAASTELTLAQGEEGFWEIRQAEPVDNEIFAPLIGETPDAAIDAAIEAGKK